MVDVSKRDAAYSLLDGPPLDIRHHGTAITVSTEAPVVERIPPCVERPAPRQPPGREPIRRAREST
jgi:alpha,alpha-trehalose phosphorylase